MYSLARNHFFYFTQAIEDIDSNAKEEMKSEEQVIHTMVMSLCYLVQQADIAQNYLVI